MNSNVTLVLLVVAIIVAVGIVVLLAAPSCLENATYTVCEYRTVLVPGFSLGVPQEQVEFDTVAIRNVEIASQKEADVLALAASWLEKQSPSANELVKLVVKGKDAGAFILAFGSGLKDFSDAIAARYGLRAPDRVMTIGKYYCFVFYGKKG